MCQFTSNHLALYIEKHLHIFTPVPGRLLFPSSCPLYTLYYDTLLYYVFTVVNKRLSVSKIMP